MCYSAKAKKRSRVRHSGLIPPTPFKFFVLLVVKMAGQTSHGYAFSIFTNPSQHPYTKQACFSVLWVVSPVHISPGPVANIKQRIPCLRSPCECVLDNVYHFSICSSDLMRPSGKYLPKLPKSIKTETPHMYHMTREMFSLHCLGFVSFLNFSRWTLFTVRQGVKMHMARVARDWWDY